MQMTLLATIEDQNQGMNPFLVDTNKAYFSMDDSANKTDVFWDFAHQNVIMVTANGRTTTVK
jgi:hypothetical protein